MKFTKGYVRELVCATTRMNASAKPASLAFYSCFSAFSLLE
ncbi:MAG: hypothetical protein ACLSSW_05870 [Acutalibacteraceae bacterium]